MHLLLLPPGMQQDNQHRRMLCQDLTQDLFQNMQQSPLDLQPEQAFFPVI